jgi:hypothetical protein
MKMDQAFFHEIVWRRFVRMPYGHVLDYAGKDGENLYPTAEECARGVPNPRSWGLPIENGAFFTGLYVYTLLEKYRRTKCERTAAEIKILMDGLWLLQDVARVEGFIARGVGEDGVSHYPMGAECQNFPWILAAFAYYNSDLCSDREAVRARLLRVLLALRGYGWDIPCDDEGVFYPMNWAGSAAWRPVTMLLFCARVIYELTGEACDLAAFEQLAEECPDGCVFTRKEILAQGYAQDMITSFGNQTWICTYTHLAVRELLSLDPKRAEFYRECLYQNGVVALANAKSIQRYDRAVGGFGLDWRVLNDQWESYGGDTEKGTAISSRQFAYWHQHIVPHRNMEHGVLGNALFAAWVAATCEDVRIARRALEIMRAGCADIDWDEVHLSYAFVAESALIFGEE